MPASRPFRCVYPWFAVAGLALAAVACHTPDGGGVLQDGQGAGGASVVRGDLARGKVFEDAKMHYVRIREWDRARTAPAVLASFQESAGATVEVYETDGTSNRPCPDDLATPDKLLHRTQAFKLRAVGPAPKGAEKASYAIRFTRKEDRFLKMPELTLKAMGDDASQMREALALGLFKAAAVPVPGHTYAKLCVNGRFLGLYSFAEDVDAGFLEARFGKNAKGNLFRANGETNDVGPADLKVLASPDPQDPGKAYAKAQDPAERTYALRTNEAGAALSQYGTYADLAAFIRTVNGEKDAGGDREAYLKSAAFPADVESLFNARAFLRWAALNMLLGAWDNYWVTPAHYSLYNAGRAGAERDFLAKPYFVWIPSDYDRAFGVSPWPAKWQYADIVDWEAGAKAANGGKRATGLPLIRTLLKNEAFLKYYLDALEHYADTIFTEEAVKKARATLWERVKTAAFLESDFPDCRNAGDNACAHTGRPFSNHEVFLQGEAQAPVRRGALTLEGIEPFVRVRVDNVKGQLVKWRQKYPKGSGGFQPDKPEPWVN